MYHKRCEEGPYDICWYMIGHEDRAPINRRKEYHMQAYILSIQHKALNPNRVFVPIHVKWPWLQWLGSS